MVKFVKYFGGNETTVYGLAGLGDLYVSAIGGRNSQMGKYLGQGTLYKDAKEKFMKDIGSIELLEQKINNIQKYVKNYSNKEVVGRLYLSLISTSS